MRERLELVEAEHSSLSIRRQCELLNVSRSSLNYKKVTNDDSTLKRILDEIYLKDPALGSRRLVTVLERDYGYHINRKKLQRLRREMGIEAIYCKPRTSIPDKKHYKYPYLLRNLEIKSPDQVWCADITYIPMERGNAYLCAVMDWYSRMVLGWKLSNTMDITLCIASLTQAENNALSSPEIFNTDQGSQFTSQEWIERLESLEIRVSMDGKGRWMDNVFIERLWRSIKYEYIYLHGHETVRLLSKGVSKWFKQYNEWRPHQALSNRTPQEVYMSRGS